MPPEYTSHLCIKVALEFLSLMWRRGIDCGSPLAWVPYPVPSSSICALGAVGVPLLQLGLGQSLHSSGRDSKMLEKGALELVDQPAPGFYSRLFLVQKATGGGIW